MNKTCTTCKHEPDWDIRTNKANICKVPLPAFVDREYGFHDHELVKRHDGIYHYILGPNGGVSKIENCEAWEADDA